MVAIGGLVGAGALGYAVALGVSRSEEWGKGMAAGISIVLLGIMLDRIMRGAARVKADPLAGREEMTRLDPFRDPGRASAAPNVTDL